MTTTEFGRSPERLAALERQGVETTRTDLFDAESLRLAVSGFEAVLNVASRSQRISNRKLRSASAWTPKFPSVREGWRDAVPALESRGRAAA